MQLQDVAQALISGLLIGAIYALVSVGLTLLFGVMDLINFAHGEFLMVGMYAAFAAWAAIGLDPLFSAPVGAVVVGAVGALTYVLLIRPVIHGSWFPQVIVTFGLLIFLRGLIQLIFSANTQGVPDPLLGSTRLVVAGVVAGGPQLVAALGALLSLAALYLFLVRTETGLALRAVSQDVEAASLMGIDVDRMRLLAFVITGALTGSAGALLMNYFSTTPTAGISFGLVAFVVVAMAGMGSILNAFVAGLVIGVVQSLVGLVAPGYAFAAIFALYLIVVMIRPQGIIGGR